jgi:hypothetical protein
MKHDDLLEFLASSATDLVRDSETMDAEQNRRNLDEAAELLSLGADILARRSAVVVRKAA